ncbi:MAG: hypothetical protein NC403_09175 [Muribaculaceae bacterium]|nr:hypothetical protein [Muribaculaceae bacterium]
MEKEQKQPTPRRVKIGVNNALEQRISAELAAMTAYTNAHVLPLLGQLNLPSEIADVIRYAADPSEIKTDWVARLASENTPAGTPAILAEVVKDRAAEKFDEVAAIPGGNATTSHAELLRLVEDEDGKRLTYDTEAVKEAATRYLTDPEQLEAYDRHQAASKAMNEFFKGKAPDAWSGLREYFWLDNAGNVTAAENVDYSRFI